MATVFFVDTNFFLQLKDAGSLRWADVSSASELFLLVPRTVQIELDRLKQDGNCRRSKRARKASAFLRRAIQSADVTAVVRDANPRVVVGFPSPSSAVKSGPATLDPTRSDDQIIAEVLNFRDSHPSDEVFLLTNDTGPMLTARYHGVGSVPIPDSWLLEPEPDQRDKTIQEMKRRLDTLERSSPKIEISVWREQHEITRIEEAVQLFEPLPESVIEQHLVEIRERCPMADEFGVSGSALTLRQTVAVARGGYFKYTKPSADEIARYRDVEYPAWLARLRQTLLDLPTRMNERTETITIVFRIGNCGTVPASNAVVEIHAHGDVLIHAPQRDGERKQTASPGLPMPPTPPLGHFEERIPLSSSVGFVRDPHYALGAMIPPVRALPTERDRSAFYWDVRRRDPSTFLSLKCEEFRHQGEAEDFEVVVIIPQGQSLSGAVSCRLSAANLPEPTSLTVPVNTTTTTADTETHLRNLIQELPRRVLAGTVTIVDSKLELKRD